MSHCRYRNVQNLSGDKSTLDYLQGRIFPDCCRTSHTKKKLHHSGIDKEPAKVGNSLKKIVNPTIWGNSEKRICCSKY